MQAELIRRGVCRLLVDMGLAPLSEMPLPNSRRADVMAMADDGGIVIVEIKSSVADFRSDGKWPDYLPFADRFYFAVDPDFPQELLPDAQGLIVADGYGGEVLREAPKRQLAAARRRSLLLRFARLAALRQAHVEDPNLESR